MTDGKPSLLERLMGRIPGYKGYAEREARRETDRSLRETIAARLLAKRSVLDRQLAVAAQKMHLDALDGLELARRRMEALADRIRHAPAGYSGFFDAAQVGVRELDLVSRFDVELHDAVERLSTEIGELDESDRKGLDHLLASIQEIEESFRGRDRILAGVDYA